MCRLGNILCVDRLLLHFPEWGLGMRLDFDPCVTRPLEAMDGIHAMHLQ